MFSLNFSLLETQDDIPEWEKELQAELQVHFTWHMEIFDGQLSFHLSYLLLLLTLMSLPGADPGAVRVVRLNPLN